METYSKLQGETIKKSTTINAGKGVEKRELFYTVGGNVNWYNHYGEQYDVSLKKSRGRITIWASNPIPGLTAIEHHNLKNSWTPVFIVVLFTEAKTCKQPKCPSMEE